MRIIGYNAHVPEPRFIVHLDDRSMEVEPVDRPTTFEGYDISAVEAFLLSGERLRPVTDGLEWGPVTWTATGEHAMPALVHAVRGYLQALGLVVDEQGDFLIEAANAMEAEQWSQRWPKRPRRLAARLHGREPMRYSR